RRAPQLPRQRPPHLDHDRSARHVHPSLRALHRRVLGRHVRPAALPPLQHPTGRRNPRLFRLRGTGVLPRRPGALPRAGPPGRALPAVARARRLTLSTARQRRRAQPIRGGADGRPRPGRHRAWRRQLVGYELYRHVLNHAPADLSKEERLLLLAIADDANERTRLSRPGVGLLEHWTGMDAQAIKRALRKLASRGWEIRVPLARRGDGSPVYAFRGRRSTYRVPVFPPRTDPPMGVAGDLQTARMGVASEHQSGANGGHSCTEWGSLVNEMGVTSDPPSPHSPHYSSSARARETTPDPSGPREEEEEKKNKNKKTTETPRTPLQIILDATDATPTEADTLLGHLTRHHHISNLPAWLTTAATNGTLTQHLANHRRRTRPTRTELCPEHTRPVDLCPFCAAQRKEAS